MRPQSFSTPLSSPFKQLKSFLSLPWPISHILSEEHISPPGNVLKDYAKTLRFKATNIFLTVSKDQEPGSGSDADILSPGLLSPEGSTGLDDLWLLAGGWRPWCVTTWASP